MAGAAPGALLDELRLSDRDRYLACLLVDEDRRDALAALYAFNAEIASVRDRVREALPGEIRLQWWRDLLEGRGEASGFPLAEALLSTIRDYRLPVAPLATMTEARIFDLYDDPMGPAPTFEAYAGETASALLQLSLLIVAPEEAPTLSEVSGHAGIAQSVAGALLLAPLHRNRGQVFVPSDILAATGLDRDHVLKGEDRTRIGAAVTAFAGFGLDHLRKARAVAGRNLSSKARQAYLPMASVERVLDLSIRHGAGVFDSAVQDSQWRRQWRLWRVSRTGRF